MRGTETKKAIDYRKDIDGMRAVAVVAVVLFHAFPNLFPGGYVGVDIFFVISGYLITGIISRGLSAGTFSIQGFYVKRVRRIFPALIIVLLSALAIGSLILLPDEFRKLGRHVLAGAGFASNLLSWAEAGYFDASSVEKPLLHLWSLGVEEQFYIFWPLILVMFRRFDIPLFKGILVLTVCSFVAGCLATYTIPTGGFYGPMYRAWELGMGGLLASLEVTNSKTSAKRPLRSEASWLGLGLIFLAIATFDEMDSFPGWRALLPVFGAMLVIYGKTNDHINHKLLSAAPIIWIGLISYPLYLWHWVILSFGRIYFGSETSEGTTLMLVALSVVLAAVTYYFVERPVRIFPFTLPRVVTVSGLMVFAAVCGTSVYIANGVPSRYPLTPAQLLVPYDYKVDSRIGECWFSEGESPQEFAPDCLVPDGGALPKILVWGDSHAGRLAVGMKEVFSLNYQVASLARSNCPPVVAELGGLCKRSNEFVLAEIKKTTPDIVVLFGAWSFYLDYGWSIDNIIRRTEDIIQRVDEAGVKTIVLVGPAPHWDGSLPRILHKDWSEGPPNQKLSERLKTSLKLQAYEVDAAMKSKNWGETVKYFSLIDEFCNENGCLARVPNQPDSLTSWDYGHLTTAGAVHASNALKEILE